MPSLDWLCGHAKQPKRIASCVKCIKQLRSTVIFAAWKFAVQKLCVVRTIPCFHRQLTLSPAALHSSGLNSRRSKSLQREMAVLSNSLALSKNTYSSSGSSFKLVEQAIGSVVPTNLSFGQGHAGTVSKRKLTVHASYSDGERSSGGSLFIGGFVLGGLVVGTLGCVYAPQISKALAGADKKDLMRKLPKFIYDEEKVLEKQRQKLTEKIEQLNLAIDDVSTQLRSEDNPNGAAVNSDGIEEALI
ncbi:hypothetical protein M9H77_20213 [Catharanthus roseus]|uniref:Uncharacterized protein n=1 Tax=Catharanthus roseus TaxID=4058 RepID=A0ACC0AKU9_CATRO|nr:hypothetical protein M9H77_20213 [Catharanthus roseus]